MEGVCLMGLGFYLGDKNVLELDEGGSCIIV